MTAIRLPAFSLVLLLGASGAGKSTFARKHFRGTEVLSSDWARGLVADDEDDQQATKDAFDVLFMLAEKRLARGRLTVVDATNVKAEDRKGWLALARRHDVWPVAIVLDMPEALCHARNATRPGRGFGPQVVRNHVRLLRDSLAGLRREGFREVWTLGSPEAADAAEVMREPLRSDRRDAHGPFDLIGDVHGCADELEALLAALGYARAPREVAGEVRPVWAHPAGRQAVFLGDLVDRGPRIVDTLWIARDMVAAGTALAVQGNHDVKVLKALQGRNVRLTHGLAQTMAEVEALPPEARAAFDRAIPAFLEGLHDHFVLDGGKLVVAHAGMKEAYQGRASGRVREFALYGETTGEVDDEGLPVRADWAAGYRGRAAVVYGHTVSREAVWVNNTMCLDTGCVFGGKLTALRWPEKTLVSVPAARVYYASRKFPPSSPSEPRP